MSRLPTAPTLVAFLLACILVAAEAGGQKAATALSPADVDAREAALKFAVTRMTRDCQAQYNLQIPLSASGLPSAYAVRLFIDRATFGGRVIQIRCAEDGASGEMVTGQAFLRGNLPRAKVDRLARQFLYLYRAQLKRKDGAADDREEWVGYISHAPDVTIEIYVASGKTNSGDSLLLKIPRTQWYARAIDERDGNQPFAIAWFVEQICALCKEQLRNQIERPETVAEIIARLQAMQPLEPRRFERSEDLRPYIETDVYASLLLRRKEPGALPEFRRLQLTDEARRLEIELTPDPRGLFQEILANEKDELWSWALEAIPSHLGSDMHRDVLVFSLARCGNPFHRRVLIDALRQLPASDAATEAVLDVYDRSETDRRVRVAATHYLLRKTHADRYFEDLLREALTPRKDPNQYDDPPSAAIGALLAIGAEDQKRRPQVTEAVRSLLERILRDSHPTWSQLEQLVSYLGRYGGPGDATLLRDYCEQSSVRAEAAYALARIDPQPALEAARRHVASQIATELGKPLSQYSNRYWNEVNDYTDLFVAFGDRGVIESYEEFLKHLAAHSEPGYELTYYQDRTTSMLKVLRAKDPSDELDCAVEFVRTQGPRFPAYGDDWVLEKLAERLAVAAGAKEEAQRRLQEARQAWRDWVNLSREDIE